MADRSDIISQLVKISLDIASLKATVQGMQEVETTLNDVEQAAQSVTSTSETLASALAKIQRAATVSDLGAHYGDLAEKIGDADKAAELLAKHLEEIGATKNEVDAAANSFARASAEPAAGGGGGNMGGRRFLSAGGGLLNQIAPGTGTGFQVAGELTQLTQQFPKFRDVLKTIGPTALAAGAGIGVATIALALLQAQAQKVKEAATAELNARAQAIGFIQTASKEEIQARVKELEQKQAINKAIADDANNVFQQLDSQTNIIGKFNSEIGTGSGELTAAREAAEKANKSVGETSTELDLLTQALDANVGATKDATEAEKKLAEQRTQGFLTSAKEAMDLEKSLFELSKMNSKQMQDRIDALNEESMELETGIAIIQASGDTSAEAAKQLTEYQVQLAKNGGELKRLTDSLPDAKKTEAAADALKYHNQQMEDTIDSVKQYNADVADLNTKISENGTKLTEALQQIIDNAAEAAQKALDKLNQKREEIATQFARDGQKADRDAAYKQINIAIKEHEQELDIYKNYRRKLRDIQKQADEQSFALALDRNFSGLFDLNRQTDAAKNQAAQDEKDAIDDAQTQRQRNLDDLTHSLEQERQERQIAMQYQIADAINAYQLERQQIEIQRRDAETKARAAAAREAALLQQQLEARAAAERQQLILIQQAEGQRLQITQQANAALIAQAQQLLAAFSGGGMNSSSSSGTSGGYSGGGGGNLGFSSSSGGTGALPARLVTSGSTSGNAGSGGGTSVQLNQYITGGANAELIGDIAVKKAVGVFKMMNNL